MALTKCRECGKEISKKADKCPHCGAPAKKKTSLFTWLVTLIIVFMAIGYFSDTTTPPRNVASKQSTRDSLSDARYSPQPSTPPLEVISWKCEKEYSYIFVIGEVKNVSSESIENLMAVGEFRTKDKTLVKTEDALVDYNPLLPNQVSPFKAGGTDNPAITNCNLSFKRLFGEKIGYKLAENRIRKEKDKVDEVQRLLSELGYSVGVVDGIMGSRTRKAIIEFQRKQGLSADGKISSALIDELRRASN